MATVVPVLPSNGAKKFRDGCTKHWQVRPNPSETKSGVRKETFCRQAQADRRKTDIKSDLHRGAYANMDDRTTVTEWYATWMAASVARGIRPATVVHYEGLFRLHIKPGLGERTMMTIRREHVDQWVASHRQAGTGPPTLSLTAWVLRSMFDLWQTYDRPLPKGNPVPKTVVKVPPPVRGAALTPAEIVAWRDAAPLHARALIEVQAYTGSRQSEIRALRPEDVTWIGKDDTTPIDEQLAWLVDLPPERYGQRNVEVRFARRVDRKGLPAPIKNQRGNRSLPLSQGIVGKLAEHVHRWPPVNGWLFPNPCSRRSTYGQPWTSYTYDDTLRKAAELAGLKLPPRQNTHALRHFCVSVLRDLHFSDQQIGEWIGDTAKTVQAVYGQPMPDSKARMMAVLEQVQSDTARPFKLIQGTAG